MQALLVAAACAAPLLVLLPIGATVVQATAEGFGALLHELARPIVGVLLGNTAGLIESTMACCALLGVGVAWLVERTDLPGRRVFAALAACPLAVPPFVTSYAWLSMSPHFEGFGGALLVVATAYYPLVYLPSRLRCVAWIRRWRKARARSASPPLPVFAVWCCRSCARC